MIKICEQCNNQFNARRANVRFCGCSCSAKWRAKNHPLPSSCFKAGVKTWNTGTNNSGMKGKHHSHDSKIKISQSNKKDAPISSANKLARLSPEYKEWRQLVFTRDNYTCTTCGSKHRIHPHHIESFAKNIELRFVVSNGITLCELCHGKVHGIDFSICRKQIICQCCNKKFVPKDGHYKTKTCSKECKYKLMASIPSKTKGVLRPHMQRARIANCLECGVEFRAIKDTKKRQQKFCCSPCYLKNRWGFTRKQAIIESTGQTFSELMDG